MFSMPPAMTSSASPRRIAWSASITAFMPEAQALLRVVAPTEGASPPKIATCRAGFMPSPAAIQLPMKTSSTWSTGTPVRATRPLTQVAASCGAGTAASPPMKAPIAVRTPATIIASLRCHRHGPRSCGILARVTRPGLS